MISHQPANCGKKKPKTQRRHVPGSSCEGAKNCILKQGLTSGRTFLGVYPDTLYFSINSRSNQFYIEGNNYYPEKGATSFDVVIPYYLPELGVGSVTIPFTMSKTDVTVSKVGTGYYTQNCIAWEIWKYAGFQNPTLDGNYKTQTGYTVNAYYRYDGDVNEAHIESFSATGSIRYEYLLLSGSSTINQHFKTSNMLLNGSIEIVP